MSITVNDIEISDELIDYYTQKIQQEDSNKGFAESKLIARNELIKRAVLLSIANENNTKVYEKDVFKKLTIMMNGGNDIEKFKKTLNRTPIGFEGFMRFLTDDIKIENFLAKKFSIDNYSVDEDEVYDFFLANQEHYEDRKKIRVSHILLKTDSNDTEEDKQFKFNLLLEIKYREGSFEEKAKQFSECESAKNGGDLGYLIDGTMPKDFENVAKTLDLDEVSNVFETYLGFHLVKCTEKYEGFEAVKDEIKNYLLNLKIHQDIELFIKKEIDEATIVEY